MTLITRTGLLLVLPDACAVASYAKYVVMYHLSMPCKECWSKYRNLKEFQDLGTNENTNNL